MRVGEPRPPEEDGQWCDLNKIPCNRGPAWSPLPCPTWGPSPNPAAHQCPRNSTPHPVVTVRTFAGVLVVGVYGKEFGKCKHV